MAKLHQHRTPARRGLFHAAGRLTAGWLVLVALGTTGPVVVAEEATLRICTPAAQPRASLDVAVALGSGESTGAPVVTPAAFAEEDVLPPALSPAAEDPDDADAEEINSQEEISRERVFRPIGQVTANAALPPGLLPDSVVEKNLLPQHPLVGDPRFYGGWAAKDFRWSATKFAHKPLYFEEVNLERYGYQCSPCVQPFVSGAHFFGTIPALPYLMVAQPPCECIYTLGHYRPGSCVPWQRNYPPCSCCGVAVETAVVVGLVFLIP